MIGWFSGLAQPTVWVAQMPGPGGPTPEEAALIFSGPQFFIALVSGLVLAFGFQLLLTNFSVAVGIAYAGHGKSANPSKSSGGGPKITTAFGLWTLITVSLSLFFACLLAVRLSLYSSALLGAITGLVIWGTYFCLLFWVSSTTVGSLIGSVVKTATSSFQSLVGTATAAIGARAASNQVVETAEATAAAVRQELLTGWNDNNLQDTLRDYLMSLRSPALETGDLEDEFERLIHDSKVTALADGDTLAQIDRTAFEDLVSRRTDLSRQETKRLADRLYHSWRRAVGQTAGRDAMTELMDYLKSARREDLVSHRLSERLDQLIAAQGSSSGKKGAAGLMAQGLGMLMGTVLNRTDLSDLDLAQITQTLKQLPHQVSDSVDTIATQIKGKDEPYSVVKLDVEAYLYSAYPWQLQPQRLKAEFWDVIYDPTADPALLRQELLPLNRAYFAELLASRGLLTQAEVNQVAGLLDEVRQQALGEVSTRYRLEAAKTLQTQVYTFLQRTAREDLLASGATDSFAELIDDSYAEPGELRDRFQVFSYDAFLDALRSRQDLSDTEAQAVASRLEQVMNRVQADAEGLQAAAQARLDNQWQALQHYLQGTGKTELNPEAIKNDIQALLDEPDVGIHRVRQRLAQFDRDTLVQLLSQRHDLSEAQVQQTLEQVEATWHQVIHAPADLTAQAQAKYNEATQAIETYLLKTGKPELNPEGIKRDLSLLVDDPKLGFKAVRTRLAQIDRDTLVQLLSQRDDLSEADINQIIDDVQTSIRDLLHMPQRLARRAKAEVMSFEQALEDYLRNTDKTALNPEGIKRDLKLLLEDPRLGAERLQARLSMIDRDAVVALLAQRPDMTQAEAEAAVDQVLAIRHQIMDQLHRMQDQVKSIIDGILARIRQYLDSLGRPELDYYGIKRDLQQMLDDPKAGFEALRQRLDQVDSDTLVAILSSHDAVSEADAQRVIDQVDEVRTTALQKAEQLEHEVEKRLDEIKYQMQQQVEETRKTAEAAAWWIFGTATVSAACAAIAGSLATL
ncbi:MAG: MFS transporter [Leptolyngbya sp. LCM1.Bin17]|nr:MAG: MFS transporter [Leptolyngbya sp. LCM1.Bin17]